LIPLLVLGTLRDAVCVGNIDAVLAQPKLHIVRERVGVHQLGAELDVVSACIGKRDAAAGSDGDTTAGRYRVVSDRISRCRAGGSLRGRVISRNVVALRAASTRRAGRPCRASAVGPVGPVAPVVPVLPVEPVGPVGPVGPATVDAAPVGPVEPVPVGPVGPVGPPVPVGPVGPVPVGPRGAGSTRRACCTQARWACGAGRAVLQPMPVGPVGPVGPCRPTPM
jgi:hypothetical protein